MSSESQRWTAELAPRRASAEGGGWRVGGVGVSGPEDADYIPQLQLSGFLSPTIQLSKVQTLQKVSTRQAFPLGFQLDQFLALCLLLSSLSNMRLSHFLFRPSLGCSDLLVGSRWIEDGAKRRETVLHLSLFGRHSRTRLTDFTFPFSPSLGAFSS